MTGIFSALNLTCLTVAYQNDKSATVSLLAYIALVYAFCADIFIFKHDFVNLELAGAGIITFFNLFTIIYKMKFCPEEEEQQLDVYSERTEYKANSHLIVKEQIK